MENNGYNLRMDGGRNWVIGGKLTFLPGSRIEGAECLLSSAPAEKPFIPDSQATTVAALREDFNHLLSVLRGSGILAVEEVKTGDSYSG